VFTGYTKRVWASAALMIVRW